MADKSNLRIVSELILSEGVVKMVSYVAPTELEYWLIIRSTNISSLRDYNPITLME
jgi:hypothetical protein